MQIRSATFDVFLRRFRRWEKAQEWKRAEEMGKLITTIGYCHKCPLCASLKQRLLKGQLGHFPKTFSVCFVTTLADYKLELLRRCVIKVESLFVVSGTAHRRASIDWRNCQLIYTSIVLSFPPLSSLFGAKVHRSGGFSYQFGEISRCAQ